jgi:hypothetical protein
MALPQSTSPDDTLKTCQRCGQSYPRSSEFWHRDARSADGLERRCKTCRCEQAREWYHRVPGAGARRGHDKRQVVRLAVLSHYSNGIPCCACCGEDHLEFLAIDHINGRGRAERGRTGRYGFSLYTWLRMQGYPEGYRVLCHNCNGALGWYGYCPHAHEH